MVQGIEIGKHFRVLTLVYGEREVETGPWVGVGVGVGDGEGDGEGDGDGDGDGLGVGVAVGAVVGVGVGVAATVAVTLKNLTLVTIGLLKSLLSVYEPIINPSLVI